VEKMGMKISVCGKGGSGKSTLVSLLATAAQARHLTTLVVDSDESNSGLFRMLGFNEPPIPLMALAGGKEGIKEKMNQPSILSETNITLAQIPDGYINEINGLKLVSIGKIHQALEGCACPMGVLSREFLKKLRLGKDEIAMVDMEAGIEHFGRGIDNNIDAVLVVVEPSFESIALAEKIKVLAAGIKKRLWAVLNKISSDILIAEIKAKLKSKEMETIGVISYDASVFHAGLKGDALAPGRATHQAKEILEFLLTQFISHRL
jgi:CO dehydrogenase maturation factor